MQEEKCSEVSGEDGQESWLVKIGVSTVGLCCGLWSCREHQGLGSEKCWWWQHLGSLEVWETPSVKSFGHHMLCSNFLWDKTIHGGREAIKRQDILKASGDTSTLQEDLSGQEINNWKTSGSLWNRPESLDRVHPRHTQAVRTAESYSQTRQGG